MSKIPDIGNAFADDFKEMCETVPRDEKAILLVGVVHLMILDYLNDARAELGSETSTSFLAEVKVIRETLEDMIGQSFTEGLLRDYKCTIAELKEDIVC